MVAVSLKVGCQIGISYIDEALFSDLCLTLNHQIAFDPLLSIDLESDPQSRTHGARFSLREETAVSV